MPPQRYPSDLTDAQWELIEPLLPEPNTGGRPEKHPRREIVNAILYVVRSGCPWRYLPTDLPPWQTVYWYFQQWEQAGVTETLLRELRVKARRQADRAGEPSAGIIDSQSVKGADTVGRDSRGYDAGKKVNGRKRFIITDTTGLLVTLAVMAATGRTATAPRPRCCRRTRPHRSGMSSPIKGLPAGWWSGLVTGCAPRWRSYVSPLTSEHSASSHAVGWSSGRWRG
ncbi:transposase [Thermocatellispora tengchongensis]|uniref:Transposase n=1 Tax=Thermocatellispora tengchongensis TaxID=1073253 RepID=A0A840PJL6_9ACTN|nr:transposase [Thermocatellispora tengchongensis]